MRIDMLRQYGNVSDAAWREGVSAAKSHFQVSPNDVVELYVAPGVHVVHETSYLIELSNVQ